MFFILVTPPFSMTWSTRHGDCSVKASTELTDGVCKDHRDKIEVSAPVVKDLISNKL